MKYEPRSNRNTNQQMLQPKQCHFCTNNREVIDYKDSEMLKKFMSTQAKIYPRRKSGLCAYHQRQFSEAVKRARYLALVPYTNR